MEAVLENTLPVAKPVKSKITDRKEVDKYSLNTICASGSCPNMGNAGAKELPLYDFRKYPRSCGFVV
jgi:lipoic acid synthetase